MGTLEILNFYLYYDTVCDGSRSKHLRQAGLLGYQLLNLKFKQLTLPWVSVYHQCPKPCISSVIETFITIKI